MFPFDEIFNMQPQSGQYSRNEVVKKEPLLEKSG